MLSQLQSAHEEVQRCDEYGGGVARRQERRRSQSGEVLEPGGEPLGQRDEETTSMVEPLRALATEYQELVSAGACATDDENQTRMTLRHYQNVSEEEEAAKLPSTLRRR